MLWPKKSKQAPGCQTQPEGSCSHPSPLHSAFDAQGTRCLLKAAWENFLFISDPPKALFFHQKVPCGALQGTAGAADPQGSSHRNWGTSAVSPVAVSDWWRSVRTVKLSVVSFRYGLIYIAVKPTLASSACREAEVVYSYRRIFIWCLWGRRL